MVQAFTLLRGWSTLSQSLGWQNVSQPIPCRSLGFPTLVVYNLAQDNLSGGYICFLLIFGIILQSFWWQAFFVYYIQVNLVEEKDV